MNTKVIVEIKSVYGREVIYPVNTNAELFTALTGTKTLSRDNIAKIKALGFTVEVKAAEL